MALHMEQGSMPHIYWIDLANDGVYTECAVMKRDVQGNIYFFPLNVLDKIDKGRMARILSNRNANAFELWDLMSQITLNNGVNALEYFHQLVEVVTPNGRRMSPRDGVIGTSNQGRIDMRGADARAAMQAQIDMASNAAAKAAAMAAAEAVRNQGQSAERAKAPDNNAPKRATTRNKPQPNKEGK